MLCVLTVIWRLSVVSKTIASLTTETGQCDHSVGLLEVNDTEIVPNCYNNNNYFYYLAYFSFSFYVTLDVINLSGVESTLVGRVFESASYIRGIEYWEYFLIFMTKPRIYFSPNGGDCAKKDGLNGCILLRPSLWIERVKPVCLSLLVHAFPLVQWHTCPATLWIWYIVFGTGMWTFGAFEDWVHYRFPALSFYLSVPIFLSEKGRFMTPLTLILSMTFLHSPTIFCNLADYSPLLALSPGKAFKLVSFT